MEVKLKDKKFLVPVVIGLVCILTYVGINIVSAHKTKATVVEINKQVSFAAKDKSQVEAAIAELITSEEKRIGNKVTLASQPQYHLALVPKSEIADQSEIKKIV